MGDRLNTYITCFVGVVSPKASEDLYRFSYHVQLRTAFWAYERSQTLRAHESSYDVCFGRDDQQPRMISYGFEHAHENPYESIRVWATMISPWIHMGFGPDDETPHELHGFWARWSTHMMNSLDFWKQFWGNTIACIELGWWQFYKVLLGVCDFGNMSRVRSRRCQYISNPWQLA